MKWLKNKLRIWLGIGLHEEMLTKYAKEIGDLKMRCARLEGQLHETQHDVYSLRRTINEYFRVDADVGHRGNNTIILTGIYRGRGYVQFYDVGTGQFAETVERMRDMNRCNLLRNIDAPPILHWAI